MVGSLEPLGGCFDDELEVVFPFGLRCRYDADRFCGTYDRRRRSLLARLRWGSRSSYRRSDDFIRSGDSLSMFRVYSELYVRFL